MAVFLTSLIPLAPAAGQTTGRILGTVTDASTDAPVASADVMLEGFRHRVQTNEEGRFILVGVPPGERSMRIEAVGYAGEHVEEILVRSGHAVGVEIRLVPRAMQLEGIVAEVDRIRLVEPEVSATHEVILGEQLLELPLDAVEEAVELVTGVTDGHFRGGRAGQEVYVVDGVELKNQFEASTQGLGFELPPTALDELEVITGGIGAQDGSALSGMVRYQTRRGDPSRWHGIANVRTDHWAPDAIFRGFAALGGGAGVAVSFQGRGLSATELVDGAPAFPVRYHPFQKAFTEDGAQIFRASWNPAGDRLVFSDGLRLLTWSGGQDDPAPVDGTSDAVLAAWSPTDDRLAFTRLMRGDSITGTCNQTAPGAFPCLQLRVTWPVEGNRIQLIRADGSGLQDLWEGTDPAWSPEGNRLAFVDQGRIWIGDIETGVREPVAETELGRDPAFSPDGRMLAYARIGEDGSWDIWVTELGAF